MDDTVSLALEQIYDRVRAGSTHSAMDSLIGYVDDAFLDGRFADVDRLLATADLDRLSPTLQLALMGFTRVAAEKLPSRADCAKSIEAHLSKTDASLIDRVLLRVL